MGRLSLPAAGVVAVDACAIIYYAEKIEPYLSASEPLWEALGAGTIAVATSAFSLLEVLVKPLRDNNTSLADLYREIFRGSIDLDVLPVDRVVLELGAELRARHNLRTPDAIHAATALRSGCTLFVTNDAAFRRVPGLSVAVLREVAAS